MRNDNALAFALDAHHADVIVPRPWWVGRHAQCDFDGLSEDKGLQPLAWSFPPFPFKARRLFKRVVIVEGEQWIPSRYVCCGGKAAGEPHEEKSGAIYDGRASHVKRGNRSPSLVACSRDKSREKLGRFPISDPHGGRALTVPLARPGVDRTAGNREASQFFRMPSRLSAAGRQEAASAP